MTGHRASGFFNGFTAVDRLYILVTLLVAFLSWLPRRTGPIDLRWDAGTYYVLGTSLAEGKGYRLLNEPGEIQAIQYPPLLPLIVASHERLLGSSDPKIVGPWLRRSWFGMLVLLGLGTFFLARLFLPGAYACVISILCLLNYEIVFVSTLCFAELPFCVVTVWGVYGYYRFRHAWPAKIGFPLTAIAAYALRSIGIAMLAAWVADAVFQRKFRMAVLRGVIAIVPVLLWQSYVASVESSADYQHPSYSYQRAPWMFYNVSYATNVSLRSPFEPSLGRITARDWYVRAINNVQLIPFWVGESLLSPVRFWRGNVARFNRVFAPMQFPVLLGVILFYSIAITALFGAFIQLRQGLWLLGLYILLSLAAISLTPWPGQSIRYLAPIAPFLYLAFFQCILFISRRFRPAVGKSVAIVFAAVLLVVSAATFRITMVYFRDAATYIDGNGQVKQYHLLHSPAEFISVEEGLRWLQEHADRTSIVAISMPQWAYLNTGLKTVMPPITSDPDEGRRMLDSVPASYVVTDHMIMEAQFNRTFIELVRNSPEDWKLVYAKGGAAIYQRLAPPLQRPSSLPGR